VPELTPGDGQDLLDVYKRAWERRDVELAMSLYAEDAEHRDHPFRDPYAGSNAIRAMWNDIAANETHVEFDAERIWVVARTVLASWHAAYTDRTNGDRVRIRGFLAAELDGERKITRLREWPVSRVVGKDSAYDVPENEQ
jgi:hypothetical protein